VTGARILVVDDDPAILKAVRHGLEGHGFDVLGLGGASDVVATIERWRPDVLVLDLVLPDGDGAEV
jgi:two-component system OmpR family response regulator